MRVDEKLSLSTISSDKLRKGLIFTYSCLWLALVVLAHNGCQFSVDPPVLLEVSRLIETLATGLTNIGSHDGVNPQVFL